MENYDTDVIREGLIPVLEIVDNNKKTQKDFGVVVEQTLSPYSRIRKRIPIPKERRQMVFIRCNNECEICEDHAAQQIHHIDGNPRNNELENLQGVCYDCHREVEKAIRIRIRVKKDDE